VSFAGYPDVNMPYAGWYRPLPEDGQLAGGYILSELLAAHQPDFDPATAVCFVNGFCLLNAKYTAANGALELVWRVDHELDLPPMPLISNPPPPGVYAGPRLLVFAQLQDGAGGFLVGDDGLWIDPVTLRPGDVFLQRHHLVQPVGSQPAAVLFGLYDPMTRERILTTGGRDHLEIGMERR
jgi:hypothetical protein